MNSFTKFFIINILALLFCVEASAMTPSHPPSSQRRKKPSPPKPLVVPSPETRLAEPPREHAKLKKRAPPPATAEFFDGAGGSMKLATRPGFSGTRDETGVHVKVDSRAMALQTSSDTGDREPIRFDRGIGQPKTGLFGDKRTDGVFIKGGSSTHYVPYNTPFVLYPPLDGSQVHIVRK